MIAALTWSAGRRGLLTEQSKALLAGLAHRVPRLGENRCCGRCREYQCEGIHIDALADLCLGQLDEVHCVSCPADHCAGVQLKPA